MASGSKGNAYVVSDGETKILLECGISWRKLQENTDFGMTDMAACLLTHEHKDHSMAVDHVIRNGVDLYLSPGTATALDLNGHRVHRMPPMEDVRIGTFIVRGFDVEHDCKQPYGYLLRSLKTREVLLFATDTAYIKYRFPGLTHVMIEANYDYGLMDPYLLSLNKRIMYTHMSLDNLKDWIKANDTRTVRQIYLLHLSDDRSNAEDFKRVVQMLTGAEVYVA